MATGVAPPRRAAPREPLIRPWRKRRRRGEVLHPTEQFLRSPHRRRAHANCVKRGAAGAGPNATCWRHRRLLQKIDLLVEEYLCRADERKAPSTVLSNKLH